MKTPNSKLGRLFFVEINAKMNAAMYTMVLQKLLKASMKMTGTEVFMQEGARALSHSPLHHHLAQG